MILKKFEEIVGKFPGRCAIKTDSSEISFRRLNFRTDITGAAIREAAGGNQTQKEPQTAALLFEHGVDMIVGVVSALKAGKIYVPFDVSYPEKRLQYMLEDSQARLLVTNTNNLELAKRLQANAPHPVELLDINDIAANTPQGLGYPSHGEGDTSREQKPPARFRDPSLDDDGIAYILYTSGSTGKPKGVMQTKRNILHFVRCYMENLSIGENDRLTLFSAFSHDAAVMDIYSGLLSGATLYPLNIKKEAITELSLWLNRERITVWHSVPTVYRYFVNTLKGDEEFPHLRFLVMGGEAVLPDDVTRFKTHFPTSVFMNLYGQSESSYNSSMKFTKDTPFDKILLGEPIDDVELMVVNEDGEEVEPFREGEIVVINDYAALGYWRDTEKTEEAFTDEPDVGRLYWTGDRGRLLLDGNIEFTGRIDFQVKIRGYRVELGEIETSLLAHGAVKETVVVADQQADGNKYLVAYVVPEIGKKFTAPELREYVSHDLLEHMIPTYFVKLDKLPVTPTGKIDRNSLPKVEENMMTGAEYAPPTDELETTLTAIWQDVLNLDESVYKIGIDHNFFNIGGHSLRATVLAARIHKQLKTEFPLKEIFRSPTIRAMARYIRSAEESMYFFIYAAPGRNHYPLSSTQKRLFALDRLDETGTGYNMPQYIEIEGQLDKDRLHETFAKLVNRHEVLRTSFHLVEDHPVQKIHKTIDFAMEEFATEGGDFVRPFDLLQAPLFRVRLETEAPEKYILKMDMHHIISDGTSTGILFREILALYEGKELPALRIQYKDYSVWQWKLYRSDRMVEQENYWLDTFKGNIPVLELPIDFPRPPVRSFEGDTVYFELDRAQCAGLNKLAVSSGGTLYMVLLALCNLLLSRYSGQEDIVIGTAVAGRHHADLQDLVGMFVNTLCLRNFPNRSLSFTAFLERVKQSTLDAFGNQDYQFEELVEKLEPRRDLSRNPLFDFMLVLQNIERSEIECEDLTFRTLPRQDNISKLDLTLACSETDGLMGFSLEYCTALFKRGTVERMAAHFSAFVSVVGESPGILIEDIDFLSIEEKQCLLEEFNDTGMRYKHEKSLYELLRTQVGRTPEATALVSVCAGEEDVSLTYRELDAAVRAVAVRLRALGFGPDGGTGIVAVMTELPLQTAVAILAVSICGGAYLPVDPAYPADRINHMLSDSCADVMLASGPLPQGVVFSNPVILPEVMGKDGISGLLPPPDRQDVDPPPKVAPFEAAYIIYTSGTTGRPKGVVVEHRHVFNTLLCRREAYDMDVGVTALQLFSYSFDGFVTSFFTPLVSGARLIMPDKGTIKEILKIISIITRYEVTHLLCVPPLFRAIIENMEPSETASLKVVTLAGDKTARDLIETTLDKNKHLEIVNEYGVSEVAVMSTINRHQEKKDTIHIGHPIWNTSIYILDPQNRLQPIGVPGEMCIAGKGVARGYLNNPELTAQKFIQLPQSLLAARRAIGGQGGASPLLPERAAGGRLYKTGDLARWLNDGNIQFLGRIDTQVKIRGFRIELLEIESCLLDHESVKDAVAMDRTDKNGDKYLCAYVVPEDEDAVLPDLKIWSARTLPDYMVPGHIVPLQALPLGPNGKIDRNALPDPNPETDGTGYEAPRDELESLLAEICRNILGRDKIGIHDNFFHIGGHSLKATMLSAQVHKKFAALLPVREIFNTPTIEGMAAYIRGAEKTIFSPVRAVESEEFHPLSAAQQRQYLLNQLETGTAYNIPTVVTVEGHLHIQRLEQAFESLIRRHESLRTYFETVGGTPVQKIADDADFTIEFHKSGCPDDPDSAVCTIVKDFIRPFDLSISPLLRVGLIADADSPTTHVLMMDMHHIVSDGASMGILVKELTDYYMGKELPAPALQYKDYAVWQQDTSVSGLVKKQETYWLEVFRGEVPVLELATDYSRPANRDFSGDTVPFRIPRFVVNKLTAAGGRDNITPFMALNAVYTVLLAKYTGGEDIVVGTPTAGRHHADLENIVGMFVNTVALRNYPGNDKSFRTFMADSARRTLEAFENQDYQFEDLVDALEIPRNLSRNPLFDTMFTLQNLENAEIELENLVFKPNEEATITPAKFDLVLTGFEGEEYIEFLFQYAVRLFNRDSIQRMAGHFTALARELAENPALEIGAIDYLGDEEKRQLVVEFNATDSPDSASFTMDTLHGLFLRQVEKYPDNIALSAEEDISYSRLNRMANRLARTLREKGTGPESIVGMLMERGLPMVVAILGILKAGGAYMPISPDFPTGRIALMLRDSGSKLLLTQSHLAGLVGQDFSGEIFTSADRDVNDDESLHNGGSANLDDINRPFHTAYVMYTSGTTGTPKGTLIIHSNVPRVVKGTNYIDINETDTLLQLSNYAFDGSTFDIYGALLNGAVLVLVPKEIVADLGKLATLIHEKAVTVFFVTAALFNALVEAYPEALAGVRKIVFGGERASVLHSAKALDMLGKGRLINGYGPTESTVFATTFAIDTVDETVGNIPIGNPITGTAVFVLDGRFNLQPVGAVGELYISGDGLGRGYLNRPELTHEKFIRVNEIPPGNGEQPSWTAMLKESHQVLYKTGDLARRLPDGTVEFLGRIDQQVKMRGFRIELGEIENAVNCFAGVTESVVVDRRDGESGMYLCAYITVARDIDIPDLKQSLIHQLPDYMVPAYFIVLDRLPLTSTGKVDRRALPEPETETGGTLYQAPRNMVEARLVELWRDILDREQVGIHDNFFQAGGHSLKAGILAARVHKDFDIKFPLTEVFKNPTIEAMAAFIRDAERAVYRGVPAVEKREHYPLSSAQIRMYTLAQLEGEATAVAYNMPAAVRVLGKLDRNRLRHSFRRLLERHEALRTVFTVVDEQPVQRVMETSDIRFQLEFHDLSEAYDPGKSRLKVSEAFIRPFRLDRAPLLRVGLMEIKETEFILMMDMHHIISDGTSMGIIIGEVLEAYGGREPEPLRIQYKDYAMWQNSLLKSGELGKQLEYWKEVLAGDIPVLEISTDFPRPTERSFEGETVTFGLEPEVLAQLRVIAAGKNTTLFMILLALYSLLMGMVTGQEDIIIGTPTAGRPHADLEKIVGMFINTLAIRTFPGGAAVFNDFLGAVGASVLDAFRNQDYQFEELVETLCPRRDMGRNPLFDTMFTLQNIDIPELVMEDLAFRQEEGYDSHTAKFDLMLTAAEGEEGLAFSLQYCSRLFTRDTAHRLGAHFINIARCVAENPDVRLCDVDMLSPKEKEQLLSEFNQTRRPYPREKTIYELFQEQADATPDRSAVVDMGHRALSRVKGKEFTTTYGLLNQKARRLAQDLLRNGVAPGDIVGIMGERSTGFLVGMLGILAMGGVYLPIDPGYPGSRINYMLDDSDAVLLLTAEAVAGKAAFNKPVLYLENYEVPVPSPPRRRRGDGNTPRRGHTAEIPTSSDPLHAAYVMYTSGTTGRPKGVLVTHRNVVRLVKNTDFIRFRENDRILQTGAVVFDAATFEIWGALLNGPALHLTDADTILNAERMAHVLRSHRISVLWLTSLLFNQLSQQDPGIFAVLRCLLVGGDVLSAAHINEVKKHCPRLHMINGYGPTENTTFSTTFLINKEYQRNIPIGKPIANSTAYVLDRCNRLAPIGVIGELYVGGDGIADGYLNNPQLTAEKFILFDHGALKRKLPEKPSTAAATREPAVDDTDAVNDVQTGTFKLIDTEGFSDNKPQSLPVPGETEEPDVEILYRTGDLVRRHADGNIEFIGRIDHQVKIRGYRIEIDEIEALLSVHARITDSIVLVREDVEKHKYLCGYIVAHHKEKPTIPDLRAHLLRDLPDYMIPSHFVFMEQLPLSINGKVDRNALPEPQTAAAGSVQYEPPGTPLENQLAGIWKEILNSQWVGINDNFFEVGGHSLKANKLVMRIRKELNIEIALRDIFKSSTIKEMARFVAGARKSDYSSIEPVSLREYYPLSAAQRRIFALDRFEEGGTAYNMPVVLEVDGLPVLRRIENAFRRVIERHESLRTSFFLIDNEPVQRVHAAAEISFQLETHELPSAVASGGPATRGGTDSPSTEGRLDQPPVAGPSDSQLPHRADELETTTIPAEPTESVGTGELPAVQAIGRFIRSFDLEKPPLLRVGIAPSGNNYLLMVDLHHIIADGTSLAVLTHEFAEIYAGVELPPLKIHYKDFSLWQNRLFASGLLKEQEEYWKREFSDDIPTLDLPLDYTRPVVQSFEGDISAFRLHREAVEGLREIATDTNSTLFMVLTALFNILAAKYGDCEDVVIGTVIAGRPHQDLQQTMGMFVNTLALRNYPAGYKYFDEFLEEVRENTLKAFENQDYPFDRLVDQLEIHRDLGRNPLFDTVFTLQNIDIPDMQVESLKFRPYEYEAKITKFDLSLTTFEGEEEIELGWEYCTRLFKKQTIERMSRHFANIVDRVVEDRGLKISHIDLTSPDERRQLIYEFNDTQTEYPPVLPLHRQFAQQARKTPEAAAVTEPVEDGEDRGYTYATLSRDAMWLARVLRENGAGPEKIVGILVNRGLWMISGLLGILQASAAYMPIDTGYPRERINYMLADSSTSILVTTSDLESRVNFPGRIICLDQLFDPPRGPGLPPRGEGLSPLRGEGMSTSHGEGVSPLRGEGFPSSYGDDMPASHSEDATLSQLGADCDLHGETENISTAPGNLAYVVYTSGTTGKPKGVLVEHRQVNAYVQAFINQFQVTARDIILQQATYAFDSFIDETYPILFSGGQMVIGKKDNIRDIGKFVLLLQNYHITIISCSPLLLSELNKSTPDLPQLRCIISGGDVLQPEYVNHLTRIGEVYNTYGPTETAVCSNFYKMNGNETHNVPIGPPIANYQVYILGKSGSLMPVNVAGELCISGDGLTRGYLNQPLLTSEKFVRNPFQAGKYMYKSGDLARWLGNGDVEFLGRMDNQVNVRGFRIELGEIEARLSAYEAVHETAVLAGDDDQGGKYLCAYFTAEKELTLRELKEFLSIALPEYMIPAYFVQMEKLPVTHTGKIDRKALPEPGRAMIKETGYVPPRNNAEETIVHVWQDILKIEPVGINDNFFSIGGDSIKAIQVLSVLQGDFEITLNDIFKSQTVSLLAESVPYKKDALKEKIDRLKSLMDMEEDYDNERESIRQSMMSVYRESIEWCRTLDLTVKARYRKILLTGATGYLGIHLLQDLLANSDAVIYLLIRGNTITRCEERLRDKSLYYFKQDMQDIYPGRIVVLNGDLTREHFGLAQEEYLRLAGEIDCIINSAAYVKHFGKKEDFQRMNVESVRILVDFALEGREKVFNHISTTTVGSGNVENEEYRLYTELDHNVGQQIDN
ncbi:MAG: amino acid adenylation domain-containing protein, partial [bacterium]|nr:amino acid adenylation domain-containing protein [bacterium]